MSVFLKVTLNRPIRRESRIDLSRRIGEAAHDDADRRRSRARGREDARDAREKYTASFRGVAGRMVASKATLAVREGVETEEQLNFLKAHRCNLAQGYLISRPIPAADLERALAEGILIPGLPVGSGL